MCGKTLTTVNQIWINDSNVHVTVIFMKLKLRQKLSIVNTKLSGAKQSTAKQYWLFSSPLVHEHSVMDCFNRRYCLKPGSWVHERQYLAVILMHSNCVPTRCPSFWVLSARLCSLFVFTCSEEHFTVSCGSALILFRRLVKAICSFCSPTVLSTGSFGSV